MNSYNTYYDTKLIQLLAKYGFHISNATFNIDGKKKLKRFLLANKSSKMASVDIKIVNDTVITKFTFGKKFLCNMNSIDSMKNFDYFSEYLKNLGD